MKLLVDFMCDTICLLISIMYLRLCSHMNHKLGVCSFSLTIFTGFFSVEIDFPTQRNRIIRLHLLIADKQVVT